MDIQPHDTFFKQIFSDSKRVKILLDIFAEDIAQDIHSITPINTEILSSKSQKFMLDLLFSCKAEDQDAYIRVVLEHKSYLDKELPIQLSYYNSAIWEEAIKEKEYYPPIINIVFYHGKGEWNMPTSLPIVKNTKLEKYTSKLNYILIDLNKISDDDIISETHKDLCTQWALLAMKHIFDSIKDFIKVFELIADYIKTHDYIETTHCIFLTLDYIVYVKDSAEEVENILKELTGGDEKVMTLTEKWKMEGKQEGLQEGLQKGLIKAKKDDIKSAILIKFGILPKELEEKIENTDDIQALNDIFKKVILATKIEEI
jgi:predicted transposase/invertase (TIGR01784 family)